MKIIDLLNMIARGEEPPSKIIWKDKIYIYNEYEKDYYDTDELDAIFDYHEITDILNDEVEILQITIHNQNKMGFVNTYVLCDSDFERKGEYSLKATEIIDRAFEEYSKALNEIIKRLSEDQE